MDLSVPGQVIPIESEEQYASYLAKEDLPISISFFWADFQPQCAAGGQMDIIFTQLAMMHPRLRFMKIEADREQLQAISEQNEIEVVPTFIVKQGKHVLEKLQGVQISELAKRVDVLNKSIASKKQSKAEQEDQTNNNSTDNVVDEAIEYRLKKLINASSVMLFMKGNPSEPKCGFSRQTIALLKSENIQFGSFDILADPEVRQALKVYSNWPTYPQLYVNGKLIGGLDILKEMIEDGESLAEQLELTENVSNGEKKLFASLKELVHSAPVLLFMKGNPNEPKCGFSRKTVAILREHEISFSTFDILTDDQVRQGLKKFSNWPTFPQLYVNGQLIGGLDIITEMAEEGDLADQLGVEKKEKLEDKLKKLISQSPVMVFMKGNPSNPQCGFSRTLVALLNEAGFKYGSFDILSDNAVRQGLKTFSNWPTYPQLYINGELIGGLDIVQQMKEDGELEELRP